MSGRLRGSYRAYMLVSVLVLVTTASVLLALAIAPLRTANLRMKEAELIYRGEHMAAGIRRYYIQYGRFPFDLQELVESEPRLVRQVYADPMTDHGEWILVYLSETDVGGLQALSASQQRLLDAATDGVVDDVGVPQEQNSENQDEQSALGRFDVNSVFRQGKQQITGIRSPSTVEGLKVRDDSRIYNDWLFSAIPKPKQDVGDLLDAAGLR